jgi:hypothetical protein
VTASQRLNRYVAAVTALGAVACGAVLAFGPNGVAHFGEHELLVFALCALLGELVPLKVYTRGAEGETSTSMTFAFALMSVGGVEAALAGLLLANLIADTLRRKPVRKVAFNMAQYAISVLVASVVLSVLPTSRARATSTSSRATSPGSWRRRSRFSSSTPRSWPWCSRSSRTCRSGACCSTTGSSRPLRPA